MATKVNDNYAKLTKRALAYILDIILVVLFISMVSEIRFINPWYDKYVENSIKYSEVMGDYTSNEISEQEFINLSQKYYYKIMKYGVTNNVATVVTIILYFGLFQKFNNGQTLGKKIMKIQVVDQNGNNPSLFSFLKRILLHYYVYVGSLIPLLSTILLVYIIPSTNYMVVNSTISFVFLILNIISFIMIYKRDDKKGIHDLISNTIVINK